MNCWFPFVRSSFVGFIVTTDLACAVDTIFIVVASASVVRSNIRGLLRELLCFEVSKVGCNTCESECLLVGIRLFPVNNFSYKSIRKCNCFVMNLTNFQAPSHLV